MPLKKREKILALSAAALVAVVALQFVLSALRGPGGDLTNQQATLSTDVQRKKNIIANGARAKKTLDAQCRRSLPSDPRLAQSLYETWLRRLATDAKLADTRITFIGGQPLQNVYHGLRFRLHARATLDQLTAFLHRFYRAGYLHRIDSLALTPRDDGASLGLMMTVEALSLADAPAAAEKLPAVESDRALASLNIYRQKIVARNIFAPYRAPRPAVSRPAPVDTIDPLLFTELNSIVSVDGRPQIWLNAKMSGKTYQLFEGDETQIGPARCKVLEITPRAARLEINGKQVLVPLGQNLRAAQPLPPATKK